MKVSANIATQKSRLHVLPQMIESIYNQVDEIRIWANEFQDWDILKWHIISNGLDNYVKKVKFYFRKNGLILDVDPADNGKFYPITFFDFDEPEIYLTCDDDIIYPPDYVEKIKAKMIQHPKHIITFHGRKLIGKGVEYYYAHNIYKFYQELDVDTIVDVAGTGVCAFNTEWFKPLSIIDDPRKRMSDLLFSFEAAKLNIPIICCERNTNWLKPIPVNDTILDSFRNIPTPIQDELADQIYELRHPNS